MSSFISFFLLPYFFIFCLLNLAFPFFRLHFPLPLLPLLSPVSILYLLLSCQVIERHDVKEGTGREGVGGGNKPKDESGARQ